MCRSVARELNKKIMELESEVDDLKNQQTASNVQGGSAMDKKYRVHLWVSNAECTCEFVHVDVVWGIDGRPHSSRNTHQERKCFPNWEDRATVPLVVIARSFKLTNPPRGHRYLSSLRFLRLCSQIIRQ